MRKAIIGAMLLFSNISFAQSLNPNSDYAICHALPSTIGCDYEYGPGGVWCDFAGWACEWDDEFFLDAPEVKAGEFEGTFVSEVSLTNAYMSSEDEADAFDLCYEIAFQQCNTVNSAFTCLGLIDTSGMSLIWWDEHCVGWNGPPLTCGARSMFP